jgi:hypothetical protein
MRISERGWGVRDVRSVTISKENFIMNWQEFVPIAPGVRMGALALAAAVTRR